MAVDWDAHRKHRRSAVEAEGQWVGMLDENCLPLYDLPPLISLTAPETRNAPVSLQAQCVATDLDGHPNVLFEDLFPKHLDGIEVDKQGKTVAALDAARFVLVERAGWRRAYRVTHVVLSGGVRSPYTVELHGTDMLSELNRHVAWSAPGRRLGRFREFTRDWAGNSTTGRTFSKPRMLQDIKLVTVADGVTLGGSPEDTAESTIREVIDLSLKTSWLRTGVQAIVDNPPIVVSSEKSGRKSPSVLVRMADEKLLETVGPIADKAGVTIQVNLWLPGDKPVPGRSRSDVPVMVVTVKQVAEVT